MLHVAKKAEKNSVVEVGDIKKTKLGLLEMKNIVAEVKNTLSGIIRLDTKLKTGLSIMKQKQKSQGKRK